MAVKRLINRVSVDAAFFKKLSPAENLSFAARLYGLDAGEARRKAAGSWPGSASAKSGWAGPSSR
jgi:ABC-type multidrug transport system ATPase subunit